MCLSVARSKFHFTVCITIHANKLQNQQNKFNVPALLCLLLLKLRLLNVSEKQNHSFDLMGQLYLIFPIADLRMYCILHKYMVQVVHTVDAKLECCQLKGSLVAGFENGFFCCT